MNHNTHDHKGRAWAKMSELKAGDKIELDGGFPCHAAGAADVKADRTGALYFECADGAHHLSGQQVHGSEYLVGIYKFGSDAA